jgi:putative oxidoreductase
MLRRLVQTAAPAAVILIRLMVGAGRFLKIGLPQPEFFGPFVGSFEIASGVFVLLGLFTRLAVVPLLVIMAVALATTKLPILVSAGFWAMAHEARTDWSMTIGAMYLLIVGAGPWSIDARLMRRLPNTRSG